MMGEKRYSIKPQDDYFGIVDECNEDRVCIVNGIHTKIEAEWLCDELNGLHDENVILKVENERLKDNIPILVDNRVSEEELKRFEEMVIRSYGDMRTSECEVKFNKKNMECHIKGEFKNYEETLLDIVDGVPVFDFCLHMTYMGDDAVVVVPKRRKRND